MKQAGIFGGSFNPPHLGHLHLADSIHDALCLDAVMLVPAKCPPHKSAAAYAPQEDRLAMCRLLAEEREWLRVEDYEMRRGGVSYSYHTVRHFCEQYPDTKFWLMVGGDMLSSFTKWYRWKEILRYVSLAAAAREPEEYTVLEKNARFLGQYGEICVVNVESLPLSSTKIREEVQKKAKYSCYLTEKIVQYIERRNLYTGCDDDVQCEG